MREWLGWPTARGGWRELPAVVDWCRFPSARRHRRWRGHATACDRAGLPLPVELTVLRLPALAPLQTLILVPAQLVME